MSEWVGSHYSIKKRLLNLVETAVSGNPYFGTVSPEWQDIPRDYAQHLPLATIRLGPATIEDEFYGRQVGYDSWSDVYEGEMKSWDFSIYCFASACRESGEDSNKYVQQLADDLTNYLQKERSWQRGFAIKDILPSTTKESNVLRMPRNVRRIMLDGKVWIRRENV